MNTARVRFLLETIAHGAHLAADGQTIPKDVRGSLHAAIDDAFSESRLSPIFGSLEAMSDDVAGAMGFDSVQLEHKTHVLESGLRRLSEKNNVARGRRFLDLALVPLESLAKEVPFGEFIIEVVQLIRTSIGSARD